MEMIDMFMLDEDSGDTFETDKGLLEFIFNFVRSLAPLTSTCPTLLPSLLQPTEHNPQPTTHNPQPSKQPTTHRLTLNHLPVQMESSFTLHVIDNDAAYDSQKKV